MNTAALSVSRRSLVKRQAFALLIELPQWCKKMKQYLPLKKEIDDFRRGVVSDGRNGKRICKSHQMIAVEEQLCL